MPSRTRKNRHLLLLLSFVFLGTTNADTVDAPHESTAYLSILGIAQDAGFPQSGCYQDHCMPAWEDPSLRHGAVSLGLVDPKGKQTFLFEATPQLPEQLFKLDQLAPRSDYELAGVFLTHAHIGHYSGLMYFGREAQGANNVPVYAMPRMTSFLKTNGPWSQLVKLKNIQLHGLQDNQTQQFAEISVTPFLVPHRDEFSETVGYFIQGANKRAVFIPDIDKWSKWDQPLDELVKSVDYALLDATFYADGELPNRDMSKIPHPLVTESMAALKHLDAAQRAKVWFIHFNHTNPLLDSQSQATQTVIQKGFNVARPGVQLPL